MSGIKMVNTLSVKHLISPDLVSEIRARPKEDRNPVLLGAILGRVRGLSLRANDFGEEPSIAFLGVFEGIPAAGPRIRAQSCFLPRVISGTLAAAALGEQTLPTNIAPKRGNRIDVEGLNEIVFAVEVDIIRDETEVGYRYDVRMYGQDAFLTSDPLGDLRGYIPGTELSGEVTMPAAVGSLSARATMGTPMIAAPAEKLASAPRKAVAAKPTRKGKAA
jgi:hypothetical protein